MDQITALQWVQRNIAAFNGDSGRVTIGGQSAGAGSMVQLLYSPLAKGLFHGVVIESCVLFPTDPENVGGPTSWRSLAAAEREGLAYMAQFNISSLAALRNLSLATLLPYNSGNDASVSFLQFKFEL